MDASRAAVLRRSEHLELVPTPWGAGRTLANWRVLAALAAVDLDAARLLEAHLDAVGICCQLDGPRPRPGELWAVWAARSPDEALSAACDGRGWHLTGAAPWCSGADRATRALVTADAPDGDRLFAVDLADPSVSADVTAWRGPGMSRCGTGTVGFDATPARPVGAPGAYLDRPGFWHAAIAVAAAWFGGAVGVARPLWRRIGGTAGCAPVRTADAHERAHAGAIDAALAAAGAALADAARAIDAPHARAEPRDDARRRALRVRAAVEHAADETLRRTGRATGPGPLAHDAEHAARVADLEVYLRQSHAERDLAVLGDLVADLDTDLDTDLDADGGVLPWL